MATMIGIKKITVQHPTKLKDVEMGFYFLEYSPKPDVIEIDFGFFDGEKFNHLSTIKDVSKFKHFLKQNFYNPYLKILEIDKKNCLPEYDEEGNSTKHIQERLNTLPNFAKADESLNALKEKLEFPEAEIISEGMVSADFVLEFTKILLSKK